MCFQASVHGAHPQSASCLLLSFRARCHSRHRASAATSTSSGASRHLLPEGEGKSNPPRKARRRYSNPFVFKAATSSAASLTITPLLRLGGGAYAVVFR